VEHYLLCLLSTVIVGESLLSGNYPAVETSVGTSSISTSAGPRWINGHVGVHSLVRTYLLSSSTVCGKMMQQVSIIYLKIDSSGRKYDSPHIEANMVHIVIHTNSKLYQETHVYTLRKKGSLGFYI